MPIVKLHVAQSLSPRKCRELAEAVRVALYEGLGLKEHYGHVILKPASEYCRACHPQRNPDFVVAEVFMFRGRERGTKQELIRKLYQTIEHCTGVGGRDVFIRLSETSREDWGIWGGRPADQVEMDH